MSPMVGGSVRRPGRVGFADTPPSQSRPGGQLTVMQGYMMADRFLAREGALALAILAIRYGRNRDRR